MFSRADGPNMLGIIIFNARTLDLCLGKWPLGYKFFLCRCIECLAEQTDQILYIFFKFNARALNLCLDKWPLGYKFNAHALNGKPSRRTKFYLFFFKFNARALNCCLYKWPLGNTKFNARA